MVPHFVIAGFGLLWHPFLPSLLFFIFDVRAGHKYSHSGEFNPDKGVTLEVFLDLHVRCLRTEGAASSLFFDVKRFSRAQCPFSKKAYFKLKEVVAHYGKDRLQFVFINWIQPWHPQASWLHAAVLAASLSDDPAHFWKLTDVLYENQDSCT